MIEAAVEHRQNQRISYSVAYYAYCGKLLYSTVYYTVVLCTIALYTVVLYTWTWSKLRSSTGTRLAKRSMKGASMRGAWRMDVLHSCTRGAHHRGNRGGRGEEGDTEGEIRTRSCVADGRCSTAAPERHTTGENRGEGGRGGETKWLT